MLPLGSHPALHPLFETLGYTCGFAVYRAVRGSRGDVLGDAQRWSVIVAAVLGALLGSRLLGWLEHVPGSAHLSAWQLLLPGGGKTIVGGLLGGWAAVEGIKKVQVISTRTGDVFAIPLCVGMAVGRLGCLFGGLADDTYGKETGLPWAVDFGDGVPRHPTQAYEVVFLGLLAMCLQWMSKRPHPNGALFRAFITAYLGWRVLVDFLKPQPLVAGLNVIQWSCVGGLVVMVGVAMSGSSVERETRSA